MLRMTEHTAHSMGKAANVTLDCKKHVHSTGTQATAGSMHKDCRCLLGILHGPAAAVAYAPINGDEATPLLWLV